MNSTSPPQNDRFMIASKIDRIWNLVFFISIIITIIQKIYIGNKDELFLIFNVFVLILLFTLEYFRDKNINEATIIRRKNLFDTTFEFDRIHNKKIEFYDNDDISNRMIKLFANNNESMLFTKSISLIMLKRQYVAIGFIGIIFLISLFNSGITEVNSITVGLLLSYFGIGRIQDIKAVYEGSSKLFKESLRITNDMELGIREINKAEILEVIINYESILSSMNFVLSDKIYNKKNDELTKYWLEIKSKYSVYNEEENKLL